MNWLDFLIIAALAWFAISSLYSGLIREVVTVVAVVMGAVLAGSLYLKLVPDIKLVVNNDSAAHLIAFLSIFLAVVLLGQLVAHLLKQIASLFLLGTLDHVGGALFGLLKGFFLVEALLIVFVTYPNLGLGTTIDESRLTPFFLKTLPVLVRVLPVEFDNAIERFKP